MAEDSAGPSHENYDIVIEGSHQIDSVDEDLEDDEQDEDDKDSCDENLLDSCVSIGSKLKEVVKADVSALYNDKLKLNIENLLQYDCPDWLNRRPPELITLLRYICNIKYQHLRSDPNLEFALARTVEQIYGIINKNLVLPLSFKENILTYKLTHSKQLINYNGRMTAAGSYTNLTGWLTSQAELPIEVPRGLIRNLMDNEQVVGKNRLIKADNKVPFSVVTSHAHISIDEESNMQTESEYKLGNWFFQQPTKDQIEAFLH